MLSPPAALAVTIASIAVVATTHSIVAKFAFASILMLALAERLRSFRAGIQVLKWGLLFGIPLMLAHGVANSSFPVTGRTLNDLVPLREAGVKFAVGVLGDFIILVLISIAWSAVRRSAAFDWLTSLRLPLSVTIVAMQSIAMIYLIQKRAAAVWIAQRARGVPVGPGVGARMKAVPAVVLPVVWLTLNDAIGRAAALTSRGLGCAPIALLPRKRLRLGWSDAVTGAWLSVAIIACTASALFT